MMGSNQEKNKSESKSVEKAQRIQVYIVHNRLMDIRKQRMDALKATLESASGPLAFSVEYIDEYNPNTIQQSDISNNVNLNRANNGEFYDNLVRNMHVTQISNALKHKAAICKGAAAAAADYVLVLEDDVLYGDDLVKRIGEVVGQMPAGPEGTEGSEAKELVFLGLPSMTPIDESKPCVMRPTGDFFRVLPCCDSYFGSRATFQKMAANYGSIRFVTNVQLTNLAETQKIKTHMVSPNIFLDGSKYGAFLSSIDPNGRLIFNPDYNRLALIVTKGNYTPAEDAQIAAAFENIKFKNHPDVMHLEAQYAISKGEYEKAGKLLDSVLTINQQNGCIINTETEFLRTHMRMYKHLQVAAAAP